MVRFSLMLFFTLLLASVQGIHSEQLNIDVAAEGAILINGDTGAILYEKNGRKQFYPASITKIATAIYTLKQASDRLDQTAIVEWDDIASIPPEQKIRANYKQPSHWIEVGSNHMSIKLGEELTLRDLLYGMMVVSANDAANVLATNVSGTIPDFVNEINSYLKELGCQSTHFTNPHGLHHPDHQSTAYDMALLTREAMRDPLFRQIVATVRCMRPKTNKQEATTLVQSNRLLRSGKYYYPKAIGVKTGWTSVAGDTFVGAAQHEGRTLIAVLLHSPDRNTSMQDTINLFEAAFKEPLVEQTLLSAGPLKYQLQLDGAKKAIPTYLKEDLMIRFYPAEEPEIKAMIHWDPLTLPITKDQRVGELRILDSHGTLLKGAPVYADQPMAVGVWQSLKDVSSSIPLWIYGVLALFIVGLITLMNKRAGRGDSL
jgi:D-alanyl-D-alanine carboxypeptidase (penicillin-binding protein 5/6)